MGLATPILILTLIDAGALDGPLARLASWTVKRPVRFHIVRAQLLSPTPSLVFGDLTVGSPSWAGSAPLLFVRQLSAKLQFWPLLIGDIVPVSLTLEGADLNLIRYGPGQENWQFGNARGFAAGSLQSLSIPSARFDFLDTAREMRLAGFVDHNDARGSARALRLTGQGQLKGEDIAFEMEGGRIDRRSAKTPFPTQIDLQDGETKVILNGETRQPFDFDHFDFRTQALGPNLADLHYLFGLLAPNSRAYAIKVRIERDGGKLSVDGLSGRVGDSDISGSGVSDRSGDRPKLRLNLASRSLAREDIEVMSAPAPARALARSDAGKAVSTTSSEVFSHKPFAIERLRQLDFNASISVGEIVGYKFPLKNLSGRVSDRGGMLVVDPMNFNVQPGQARLAFTFDARSAAPRLTVNGSLIGARLAALDPKRASATDGVLNIWLRAAGTGASPAAVAASSQGRAAFNVSAGHLPAMQAAALGGYTITALSKVFSKGSRKAGLNCAIGEFQDGGGQLRVDQLQLVLGEGAAEGSGKVDLRDQRYDIVFKPLPNASTPFQLNLPVELTGPLGHPKAELDFKHEGSLKVVKAVVGAALLPIKAIFSAPGSTSPSKNCASLLRESAAYVSPKYGKTVRIR